MTAPETIQVMTALGEARFVGGHRRAKWPMEGFDGNTQVLEDILRDKKKNRRHEN